MHMHNVKSSAIEAIGHDAESKTLRVRFHSGRTYEYPETTSEEHADFVAADSIGSHFNRHIKGKGGVEVTE